MKKIIGIFVLAIVLFFTYIYISENLRKPLPVIKTPTTIMVNIGKFISDSLPLPIELKVYNGQQVKLIAIDRVVPTKDKLNVYYKTIVTTKDFTDECILVLKYAFYISGGDLDLSTIEIDYSNSRGKFIQDLKEYEEFIIGGLEEHWKRNQLSLPIDSNEIIELSENSIIVR